MIHLLTNYPKQNLTDLAFHTSLVASSQTIEQTAEHKAIL
jgi:hypothetical protein